MSTGGFTTDTSGVVQAVAIDQAIGEVFTDNYSVKIANNVTSNQPNNRAVGRAFRASYNGSNRQYGFDLPAESLAAAAGRLVSETLDDGNEWHTATFQDPATGGGYGFANPTTSGSPEYVDALIRLPFGIAQRDIEDIVHSHPGNLEEGPF
ncbi:hypothetical protein [Hyphococcus lacteus]|uniref:Uncharacterized protein n=1 Tax=Hyphococcus lacteus TaxID=3143536 RepID=A0ABV3Z767_9PROT